MPHPSGSILVLALLTASTAAQTNTLLIVGDDMGVDTIGIYKEGRSPAPTPNIDKLAVNGVLFRNAYSCPVCTSTRATIMTGRYGFRNGMGDVGVTLPRRETILPEVLATGGRHATALIGKWHLGGRNPPIDDPNQHGWGHFSGSIGSGFRSPQTYFHWNKVINGTATTSQVYATTDNVNDAIAWIKAQTGNWVLSLNFNAPHEPFHEPPSNLHTYNLTGQNPTRNPTPFYKAAVQAMDTEIGRLLASIDPSTLSNTNVIFVGDNGTPRRVSESPFAGQHAKGSLYDGGWNVPLIVSGPSVQSPGREVRALVHTVDLFHTIAEFAGLDARKVVPSTDELDGISIVPYLTNASQRPLREFVYTEFFNSTRNDRAVRNDDYKLIVTGSGSAEFYDLVADPFETRNLLSGTLSATQKENLDRLTTELSRLRGDASWFAFGKGCAGKASVPVLAAATGQRPISGGNFTTTTTGIGTGVTQVVGILGFSRTSFGAFSLPLDLTAYSAPGCTLYTSLDVLVPISASGGSANWSLFIPPVSDLYGFRFFQQVIVPEVGANAHNSILTNAGEGTIERK